MLIVLVAPLVLAACGGGGGGGSGSSPSPVQSVSVSLSVSTAETYLNDTVELSWSSSGGGTCTASGDWSGTKSSSGTETVPTDTSGDFSFTLSCANSSSTVEKTANLSVLPELSISFANQDIEMSEDETKEFNIALATTNRQPISDLTYSVSKEPENGSVVIDTGMATYTPNADFSGTDTLEITAEAENQSATSQVNISISSVNDAPSLSVSFPLLYVSSELPVIVSGSTLSFPYTATDPDNSASELSYSATIGGVSVPVTDSGEALDLAIDDSFVSGSKTIQFSVSDGEAEATGVISLWIAKTLAESSDGPRVNQLLGNIADTNRGFNYVVILDGISEGDVRDAAYGGLLFYVGEFLSDADNRRQALIDSLFNVYVVDFPTGVESGLVVEKGCAEDDPEVYCAEKAADSATEFVSNLTILSSVNTDSISIITSLDGRGVNRGNVNVQPLLGATNGSFDGPNAMLKTLKHEFGHAFQILGDHYTDDFQLEDDDGNKLVDMTSGIETLDFFSVDITLEDDAYNVKWKHHYQDLESINGVDTTDDKSNSAVGYWSGCYYHDKECFRSTYNSIMNQEYSSYTESLAYDNNRTQYDHTQFDKVAAEAFFLAVLQEQGINSINAEISDAGDLLVGHTMQLPAELFAIDWYIDGTRIDNWDSVSATWLAGSDLEDENGNTYVERIQIPKGVAGTFSTVAYRVRELNATPVISVPDELDVYGDVYLGAFSSPGGGWICAENNTSWSEVGITYCHSTLSIRLADGWTYSPDYASRSQLLAAKSAEIYYFYEDSGLGSQFSINWDFFQ